MSTVEGLFNAARRYLGEPLEYRESFEDDTEAYDWLPRSTLAEGILLEVERFVPSKINDLSEARELIVECGSSANAKPWAASQGEDSETEAIERARFIEFVRNVSETDLAREPARPYRRTLSDEEISHWLTELARRWGVKDHGCYWFYPLYDHVDPSSLVVLDAIFWENKIVGAGRISELLAGVSSARLIEIREFFWSSETDLPLLRPFYPASGGEVLFTDTTMDWLIYASHERTVTLAGGRLLASLERVAPDWRNGLWTAPTRGNPAAIDAREKKRWTRRRKGR